MVANLKQLIQRLWTAALTLMVYQLCQRPAAANPTGGVVGQGSAGFNTSGSTFTINQSSANAYINWNSFNIGAGETTTFNQPSATSVTWNHINDANPSQILGNLNANGYIILQNQNGFSVGGSAVINAHGLVMTTSASPAPNLDSGGAWSFSAPPPSAKIINYGQINLTGGGSGYLIASDIENNGTISAPGGKIGLYAGQKVLLSTSPDGRGLSAELTLPQGSVDNEGKLIADAGTILAQAKTVNQNGLVQANSVQNINGVIELVASDSLKVGANSDIEANGDATATAASPGGFVVLQGANTYSDTATSKINVSGQSGGQNGIVEIFGNNLAGASSVQSTIGNNYAELINPFDVTLSSSSTDSSSPSSPNLNITDLSAYSQIDLQALDNIELGAEWFLNGSAVPASLSLRAGNSIILDDGSGINAGNNWSVNLTAGPKKLTAAPASGTDGIYLNGSAYIQTQNGDINLWAANEVLVATDGSDLAGYSGIRTMNGGNISVTAEYGDINAGANPLGFVYLQDQETGPYYAPATDYGASLGGISTAAGGNVTINAGGNVFSYLPAGNSSVSLSASDGGSGAFGPEPGNVTITAGGNIYGHYVLADGIGIITAGRDIGAAAGNPFALSLMTGHWNVSANDDIYMQEVRNPNGVFDNVNGSLGSHLFDYAADASVKLSADGVYLTSLNVPRPDGNVLILYPPILDISAGAGGVTLDGNVTLFPSADQSLDILTADGGNLFAPPPLANGTPVQLYMSDSSKNQWNNTTAFGINDHGTTPESLDDPNPVVINISGSMENLILITSKATQITVGGDMLNCGFSGENLSASDVTFIKVAGQIYNQSAYSFVTLPLGIPSIPSSDLPFGYSSSWDNIFTLALNPATLATLAVPTDLPASQWVSYIINSAHVFPVQKQNGILTGVNPGFTYDASTGKIGFGGPMPQSVLSALGQPITILHLVNGLPVIDPTTGRFQTDIISWASPSAIQTLFAKSQGTPSPSQGQLGYRIGGPGEFDVDASSISLGNSYGILSSGVFDWQGGFNRYNNLASVTAVGATLNVTVSGDLSMLTSTIASLGGGDVNVTSTSGSMDLGSESLYNSSRQVGFGIFSSGGGDVTVKSFEDVNIDGSRVATYNGGNILVESYNGNVDVGSGGDTLTGAGYSYVDPVTGKADFYTEKIYGNGIVANTLVDSSSVPGSAIIPGNITVETPRGDIVASLGGITQEALNGNVSAGPIITLIAGTFPSGTSPGYAGNIDLGQSGVIGGTVNATANGNITGLIISRQNSDINAAQNFSGTVLAGGSATLAAGGSASGTIVGVGGVSASTGGSLTASLLGQSVSGNGVSQNTLGASATASTAAQSASQAANTEAKQQTTASDTSDDEDKKKKKLPMLQRMKRVTVLLGLAATPR